MKLSVGALSKVSGVPYRALYYDNRAFAPHEVAPSGTGITRGASSGSGQILSLPSWISRWSPSAPSNLPRITTTRAHCASTAILLVQKRERLDGLIALVTDALNEKQKGENVMDQTIRHKQNRRAAEQYAEEAKAPGRKEAYPRAPAHGKVRAGDSSRIQERSRRLCVSSLRSSRNPAGEAAQALVLMSDAHQRSYYFCTDRNSGGAG